MTLYSDTEILLQKIKEVSKFNVNSDIYRDILPELKAIAKERLEMCKQELEFLNIRIYFQSQKEVVNIYNQWMNSNQARIEELNLIIKMLEAVALATTEGALC
jgi:hypothetical protein